MPAATNAAATATRATRSPGSREQAGIQDRDEDRTHEAGQQGQAARGRTKEATAVDRKREPPGRLRAAGADGTEPSREREQRARRARRG